MLTVIANDVGAEKKKKKKKKDRARTTVSAHIGLDACTYLVQ